MIKEITPEGYLKFSVVGQIDPRVLCGRHLRIGDETHAVKGVIATKAIHLQTAEERTHATPAGKMYVDIGAKNADEASKLVSVGDYAVFDSDFVTFGKDDRFMKGKALNSRAAAAALIEVIRDLHGAATALPFDVYFAFTTCGEIGIKGAAVAANTVKPSLCITVEGTEANDLPDVGASSVVCRLGDGVVLPLADQGTLFDVCMIRATVSAAELAGAKTQIRRGISGWGEAAAVQQSMAGVRTMELALPGRYARTASVVALREDYVTLRELLKNLLRDWKL